ncbi:MAG: GIY-YIG nuclease family protein [Candidatus Afipia apatlaquensis]|uniref:GIY-YIG nuclease family protein n=1 Tax=Candidatus Afipia apatlaquensis TaxID=2712852 RepID=A0A7C9VHT5_9BRAD|nr:GIY-YIG nuclease family protein [Candidatus Afipia apatlaquensis]
MPVMFNSILSQEGIDPALVRLLRHQDNRAGTILTPYAMWRDNRPAFEQYQCVQSTKNRPKFKWPLWASFVADPFGATLFVGLYSAQYVGVGDKDIPRPHTDGIDKAGMYDLYKLDLQKELSDLSGKLYVDWGLGTRAWVQLAQGQNKPIAEIRSSFKEEEFPGFSSFIKPLSEIPALPKTWIEALRSTRGVYLLSCPKTKQQYVGAATGENGFWGRWQNYVQTGHGGNIGLKIIEPSDYRVSILEVAGSQLTTSDIVHLEQLWKAKLQSKEMGLNKN